MSVTFAPVTTEFPEFAFTCNTHGAKVSTTSSREAYDAYEEHFYCEDRTRMEEVYSDARLGTEVNYSNSNARHVLVALGLVGYEDDLCGSMSAQEFLSVVEATPALESLVQPLDSLREVAQAALDLGVDVAWS